MLGFLPASSNHAMDLLLAACVDKSKKTKAFSTHGVPTFGANPCNKINIS